MKYKVFYGHSYGTGNQGAGVASFYTRAQAENSASAWNEMGGQFSAYMWDGSSWTTYS